MRKFLPNSKDFFFCEKELKIKDVEYMGPLDINNLDLVKKYLFG